jgi:hypothetical protein
VSACAVTVISDWVRIDCPVDFRALHRGQSVRQHLIAGSPGFHSFKELVLHAISRFKRALNAGRNIGLTVFEYVAHVLCIGRKTHCR